MLRDAQTDGIIKRSPFEAGGLRIETPLPIHSAMKSGKVSANGSMTTIGIISRL
jgi:hypothetical protein